MRMRTNHPIYKNQSSSRTQQHREDPFNNEQQYQQNFNQQNYNQQQSQGIDVEQFQDDMEGISQQSIISGFIRKVYSILSVQLLFTVAMCAYGMTNPQYFKYQIEHPNLVYVALILSLVTMIILGCFRSVARSVPINYIFLFFFTLCEGYIVSYFCNIFQPQVVIMAAVYTLAITLALTIYTFTTKLDPTMLGGILFSITTVAFMTGFFLMFTNNKTVHIIYCAVWALIYSAYIIYDTAIIIGKFSVSISADDYILAALSLYIDIIGLFLQILQLTGSSDQQ